jgi:hypothetical protein
MKNIITPKQIKDSTVKIVCDKEQGTGFLISKNILLTAYHVVFDTTQIKIVMSDSTETNGKLISKDENFDIAIIKIETECSVFLPLQSRTIRYNEKWETNAFPFFGQANDLRLTGKVNQIQIDSRSDFILNLDEIESYFDYGGCSGAPVVLSDKVGGVILQQEDDKLLAITISKIKAYLIENNIEVAEEENPLDIPEGFKDDLKSSTPNYVNHNSIDKIIQSSSKWLLLTGSPGSGKTITIASYLPEDDNVDIIGRYFIKVPNDKTPKALKTSRRYFIQWLEEIIHLKLTGNRPPLDDNSFEKKLDNLSPLLNNLGSNCQENGEIGIIIIDGLDEIPELEQFLDVIPKDLPEGIKFLISCTSKEILPSGLKSIISQSETVLAVPINLGQCEAFIQQELGSDTLEIENVQEIAIKSEGHPLYLRYLVNYVKTLNKTELDEIDNWLVQIPSIGGDISIYYDSLWDKLYEEQDKLWIVLILSWLRQAVKQDILIKMIPEQYKLSFISHFDKLKFLLKGDEYLGIYHNSFKDYIIDKTELYSKTANDKIYEFCSLDSEDVYSTNNSLYHLSQSSNQDKAISYCNQDWADKCALNSVSPELVIGDLKEIINISIDAEQTVETIRLLLLLQRIEFRYDSVFAENANLIASALISLGQYEASLKYLVRDNTLLVDNADALMFLQLFYEKKATTEATIVFEAIGKRYRKLIDEGTKSDNGIDIETLMLQLNAFTLSMNDNIDEGIHNYSRLTQVLRQHQDIAEKENKTETYKSIYALREYASSWQNAYALRRFDIFMVSERLSKVSRNPIDEKWAKRTALGLILFDEIGTYNTRALEKTENYFLAIQDVENLIVKYGYTKSKEELQILIYSIIDHCSNSDLVKTLILEYLEFEFSFSLRKENGVDLNYKDIHQLYSRYKFKGYIDEGADLPAISKTYNRHEIWEEFTVKIIKNIAFLDGKSQFLKAQGLEKELDTAIEEYSNIFSQIDFSFDERSFWDRSYSLPEAVYPLIYSKITWYLTQFSHHQLVVFLENFKIKSQNQAGLYSEGFRKSLSEIIYGLVKAKYDKKAIKKLLDIWSTFVLDCVENRWERTADLLKMIELYGLIKETKKGSEMFSTMLETSMGPSWYKEAQLDLLNTTIGLSNSNDQLNKYMKEFATILDYASGEMTFQRYVRVEKEVFIGNLIKSGNTQVAFDYFKTEVLPSPELIIRNAEKNILDAPRVGDGYSLGARNITEQSAVLQILNELEVKSLYLKWALAEVFTINDDVFRYCTNFGHFQAELLKNFEETKDTFTEESYKSVIHIACSDEFIESRIDYLNCFKGEISEKGIKTIQGYLLENNIQWDIGAPSNKSTRPDTRSKEDSLDKFNHSFIKEEKGREEIITEGLRAFKAERVNIWLGNWSNNSSIAKNNLKQLFSDDLEVFSYLKEFINNYSYDTWSMTSKLIWFLEGKLSIEKTEEVYKAIIRHFTLLVRPDSETIEKYAWIKSKSETLSNDELLSEFLIWFLNHPNKGFSKRAFNSLQKLAVHDPGLIIPILLVKSCSDEPNDVPIKCSVILKNISIENPEIINSFLEKDDKYLQAIVNVEHFTIKKNFLDCAINISKVGSTKLYNALYTSFLETTINGGDVVLEEDYLEDISYEIDALNNMQILNGQFCKTMLKTISDKCKPLSIDEFIKSDRYLTRSFPNDYYSGRFKEILNYAINMSITSKVSRDNLDEVYNILNYV